MFHDTVIKRVQSFCNSAMKLPPNQINLFNHFIKSIKVSSDGEKKFDGWSINFDREKIKVISLKVQQNGGESLN